MNASKSNWRRLPNQTTLERLAKATGTSVSSIVDLYESTSSLSDVSFKYEMTPEERLDRIIEVLQRQGATFLGGKAESLSLAELEWLIETLESQRRSAHRPMATVWRFLRGWRAQSVWRLIRGGTSEKAAVSKIAEERGISESTLRRAIQAEQSSIERTERELNDLHPELGKLWGQKHPGKPEEKRSKKPPGQ